MLATVLQFALIADGGRFYTFSPLPGGERVVVRFVGPRNTTVVTVPVQEARDLWARLRRRGYERW